MTDDPPTRIGLCCAKDQGNCYMPLEDGDSTICPMCDKQMVIYLRASSMPWTPPEASTPPTREELFTTG